MRRELRRFDAERGASAALREQVRIALAATPRFQGGRRLLRFEHQVFSQGVHTCPSDRRDNMPGGLDPLDLYAALSDGGRRRDTMLLERSVGPGLLLDRAAVRVECRGHDRCGVQ